MIEKIKISEITIHNYLKNNLGINKKDLIDSYYLIYGLLGLNSEENKKTIKKQIENNLGILKERKLINNKLELL